MTTDQSRTVTELKSTVSDLLTASERLALCLDFDGTLAPLVEHPDDARLPSETRRYVQRLGDNPAVDVAVISGRALEDVRSRVDVDGLSYAGNHGLELQQGEDVWVHPDVEEHRPTLERTVDRIEGELAAIPGSSVEDKYATVTVHYRRAGTDASSLVIATVQDIVEREARLTMAVDNQTVEIRPDIEQRKGHAVTRLVDVESGTGIIYCGDAQTDVDAFETLASLPNETIEISVGDNLPARGYHLDSPSEVQSFLQWLALESRRET